jgi:Asp-tRNA(Asn)/Glu-tRNA(Gln) amidotransferase A subunit family amidase
VAIGGAQAVKEQEPLTARDSQNHSRSTHSSAESRFFLRLKALCRASSVGLHTRRRWPACLQLIGRPQGDAALLQVEVAYEIAAAESLQRRPVETSTSA